MWRKFWRDTATIKNSPNYNGEQPHPEQREPKQPFRLANYSPSITAGTINGILIVIFQSAYAALIFSGDLTPYVARGTGLMLFGAFIMGLTVALSSSFHSTVTAPQDAPTAIMALIAAAITAAMAATGSSGDPFITVVCAIALTSLLAGLIFLALGWFKLGNLIRFIPYPVVGGFLAGTGWILVKGAVGIMAGMPLRLERVPELFADGMLLKWLPGLIFALALYEVRRRYRHFLIMPVMILAAIAVFYAALFLGGISIAEAASLGWLPARGAEGVAWQPLLPADFARVDWMAILRQAGDLGTIVVIAIISLLLNASGLELVARQEIDLNQELRSTGLANLLGGLGSSAVGYMSLSLSTFGYRIGSRHRLSGLVSASLCGLTLFLGGGVSAYFPKPLLGGLLFFLGLAFLVEWLYNAWFKLPHSEYFLVALIMVTIGFFGFLSGMLLGILIAVILFVINYSRVDVIKNVLSGANYRSNVDRAVQYQRLLGDRGEQLQILRLQGFIFFGTANNILNRVKERVHSRDLAPLHYLILDFRMVSGLDSSALNSFEKMKLLAENHQFTLIFSHLHPPLAQLFQGGGMLDPGDLRLRIFPDLDRALEWVENRILEAAEITAGDTFSALKGLAFLATILDLPPTPSAADAPTPAARLMPYLERRKIDAGEYLIHQGNPPVGLYLIESGQVTAQLEDVGGKTVRLRTMRAGTVVGELSVYLNLPATASVVANQECRVLFLSLENLRKMEAEDPETASILHRFSARILGERLQNSNKTLRALLE